LPAELKGDERQRLLAAELDMGMKLHRTGSIFRIWRIPGGLRNVGIWHVADATELHALLEQLPLYPFIDAEVTALATHPIERGLALK
jgi:muconolactone D-isomerase